MTFLVPLGLLSLLALPVIVWLHLRRERLKRVIVPSLMLWQHLPRPIDGQRRRLLPLTLLLLLHLLIAAMLGLALSHPQALGWLLDRRQHVALIIDTSTSMEADDTSEGTRFEQARNRARALINSLNGNDQLWLIAAGPQAHLLAQGGVDNRGNLLLALDQIEAGGAGTDIAGALTLAGTVFESDSDVRGYDDRRIVVLSDLERPQEVASSGDLINWEQVGSNSDNRAIVAFAGRPRGIRSSSGHNLYIRVANYSDDALTTHLRLFSDSNLIDTRLISLRPDKEVELTWTLPGGMSTVRAELDGQDALPIDDSASLSLDQTRSIKTLLVSATPDLLERALNVIPGMNLVTISPDSYPTSPLVSNTDLTIFDGTLAHIQTWPQGGVLVINPPVGATGLLSVEDASTLNGTLYQGEDSASLLDSLSLDSVDFGPVTSVQVPSWASVRLASQEEARDIPLIISGHTDQSDIAIWAFDLAQSNLATKLAFPLLIARAVRDLTPPSLPVSLPTNASLVLHPSPHADTVEVLTPDNQSLQLSTTPDSRSIPLDNLVAPGLYRVVERKGGDVRYEGHFAVNAGSPLESDLRPHPALVSRSVTGVTVRPPEPVGAPEQERQQKKQQPIWTWFALAALIILMIEWIYASKKIGQKREHGLP